MISMSMNPNKMMLMMNYMIMNTNSYKSSIIKKWKIIIKSSKLLNISKIYRLEKFKICLLQLILDKQIYLKKYFRKIFYIKVKIQYINFYKILAKLGKLNNVI